MTHADIVVVGLGSVGSQALWQAARKSSGTVLGIEQYGKVHAQGAYSGESRLFRVAVQEGGLFTEAAMRARVLWKELGRASGKDILLETGALHIAPRDHAGLNVSLASAENFDLPHQVFDAAQLRASYPQFAVEDNDVGLLDLSGGATRPELAVASATDQAQRLGASAWFDTEVLSIEPQGQGVRVLTSRGLVLAQQVIVTAGPWTRALLPALGSLVSVVTYALTWFMPQDLALFTPDKFPGFLRDMQGMHAFGVPTLDGFSIKMCPHIRDLPLVSSWQDRPRALSRDDLREISRQAQAMIPGLLGEPSRWSLHSDSYTPSEVPIIDRVADGRLLLATGMSGRGFKFSPAYGEMLVDLALTGHSPYYQEAFSLAAHREMPS